MQVLKQMPLVKQGRPLVVNVPAEHSGQISVGDLCWYHNGIVRPASLFPPGLSTEDTLSGFAELFIGLAIAVDLEQPDGRHVGTVIDLGTQAVYRSPIVTGDYDIGDRLTVLHGDHGLENQRLVRASHPNQTIAVAMERRTKFDDSLQLNVQFCSRFSSLAALQRATA